MKHYKSIFSFCAIIAFLIALLAAPATPANAGATISSTPVTGSWVIADTAYNLSSVVTNTFGVTKNTTLEVYLPEGIYFNGASTVNTGTMTCTDVELRRRQCTASFPAGASRTITTPTMVGEGYIGGVVFTTVYIDSINYAGEALDYNYNPAAGFYTHTWDAIWDQNPNIHYTHNTATYEYTFLQINYSSLRSAKITFFILNGEVTNIGLCKWNGANCTTGWLGSASWVDASHQGASITYTSWDSSNYALLVFFNTPPTAGSSYLQVVHTAYVGSTGYRATDVKDIVVID